MFALQMEQKIRNRTGSRIGNLLVVVDNDQIELFGTCESYYAKQLAQEAVMENASQGKVVNRIEVEN